MKRIVGCLLALGALGTLWADDNTLNNPADQARKAQRAAPASKEEVEALKRRVQELEDIVRSLQAQSPHAAEAPAKPHPAPPPPPPSPASPEEGKRLHSWELPPVVVSGQAGLVEEERVGTYHQPRWTARRLFGETRTYVIPEGQFEYEFWFLSESPQHGPTTVKTQHEVEIGLPNRFQVDVYAVNEKTGNEGPTSKGGKFEMRWAFADWGEIPGNPTIYTEWEQNDAAPDHFENKLLFTGEMAPRWHWGTNLVYEHETGGNLENSYEFTAGISHVLKDQKFSLGAETKLALVDNNDLRGNWSTLGQFQHVYLVGPTMQYRPLPQMHVNFAALFGLNLESPAFKPTMVLGWEF